MEDSDFLRNEEKKNGFTKGMQKTKDTLEGMVTMPVSLATNTVNTVGKTAEKTVKGTVDFAGKTVDMAGNVVGQTMDIGGKAVGMGIDITAKTVGIAGTAVNIATLGMAGTGVNAVGKMSRLATKKIKRKGRKKLLKQHMAWDSRVTAPYIKVNLQIECQRLPKPDSFGHADSFACLWEVPSGYNAGKKVSRVPSRQEREVGRTEIVRDNKNPIFTTVFPTQFKFQEDQCFVVRVYNEDLRYSTDLAEHDFVGGCLFTLGELIGACGCTIARPLRRGKSFVILTGQEIIETREVLEFRFSGQDLGLLERKSKKAQVAKEVLDTMQKLNVAKTVLEKFDAYFRIEKLDKEDQSWSVVWKSEVVRDNENPTWNAARLPTQLLCDEDPENPIKVSIWVWNRFAPDEYIGFVETSLNELVKKAKRGIPVFDVMAERKKIFGGIKLKKAGILKALKSSVIQIPSMLQYISGGTKMDLMFAIDCSAENREWRNEESLHYNSDDWMNDYQAIIHKIGTIYDSFELRHEYSMVGYGATIHGKYQPFFSMGENLRTADDLLKCYDYTFSEQNQKMNQGLTVELRQIIQAAMYRSIRLCQEQQSYTTLVILSTGAVDDIAGAIDAVCAASEDAPLSIAIIGIGDDGEFDTVFRLTGLESGKLRHSNGVPVARDIVHFAPMYEFHGNVRACVSETLHEIPEQFVQFFTNAGIKPNPPRAVPDFTKAQVFRGEKSKGKKRTHRRK